MVAWAALEFWRRVTALRQPHHLADGADTLARQAVVVEEEPER